MQANMAKQLAKLVKVRFVDDLTDRLRMGTLLHMQLPCDSFFSMHVFFLFKTPIHYPLSTLKNN
jgi:hypothetical protein